jgi:RimJ/RimL family protein N-acetyltransferase
VIETDRLRLRGWRKGDGAELMRHTNTPAVMRWLGGVQAPELFEASEERQRRLEAERGHCFWIVERREDDALLGFCGLKIADAPNSTVAGELEIGWRLREDAWGRGYAKEGALASLAFAFDRLQASRVVAITVTGNSASWGLMERLGMTRRADLDYDDPRFPELNPAIVYVMEKA